MFPKGRGPASPDESAYLPSFDADDTEESEKAAADFEDLKLTRSNPFASDVINQGNSKLEGIRRVGKEYGFDLNQVMAFC